MIRSRWLSAITAFCLLFGIPLMGTSCTPEDLAGSIEQFVSPTTQIIEVSDASDEPTESDTAVTLPGEDTVAPDCAHEFDEWVTAREPKCEEDGLRYRVCELCNGRQEETVDATGHTETDTPAIPSTCTMQGSEGGTHCAVCKAVLSEPTPTPVKEHSFHESGICTACGAMRDQLDGLGYLDLYNQTYGYEYLGTMENGAARQQFYRMMDEQIRAFHTDPSMDAVAEDEQYPPLICTLNFQELGLSKEDAQQIWKTYRDDNPLYYWLSNLVACTSKMLYLYADSDYAIGTERIETNGQLYQNITVYLSKLPANATDYQIALLIHDAMIDAIDYAYDQSGAPESEAWAHNILGVFDGRGAVCEGFARAYQLLLNFKGVDCLLVTGESLGQGHAWNVIELDGLWYGVDVTWDDGSEETDPYAYFCLSETEFYQSHTKDSHEAVGIEFLYEIPALAEYGIEWVELYQGNALVGRFTCIDLAFGAMTDPNWDYTIRLLDGKDDALLHDSKTFHVYGAFPSAGSLTVIGTHQIIREYWGSVEYTAVGVCLEQNVTLQCDVVLQSLFLKSERTVTVDRNGYTLTLGDYSALKDYVTVKRS